MTLMEKDAAKPSLKSWNLPKRKSVSLNSHALIETEIYDAEKNFPLVVKPLIDGLSLNSWAIENRDFIETKLTTHGAVLFRGFNVYEVEEFERFIQNVSGQLLEYTYRSTPRSKVSGRVYTSTEYPPEMSIPMHNENSYSRNWAMKLFFLCVTAAEFRGETPIADSRLMYARIDREIRELFERKNVMYVRNYGSAVDLPWQNVFQTENRCEVEEYCRKAEMSFEWLGGDCLRTRQICQSTAKHPKTGETVWFNQANLFHIASLPPEVQKALRSSFDEESLPRNALFGDGSPIHSSIIEHINQVYAEIEVAFPWQRGDVLMLDNMLTAHGRNPFSGARKIVVGMSEPYSNQIFSVD